MQQTISITATDITHYKRLDQFLAEKCPDLSRSQIKTLFQEKHINALDKSDLVLNRMPKKPCTLNIDSSSLVAPSLEPFPENIPLHIYYQDEDLVVLEKPAGMIIHSAPGHHQGTLVNALLFHFPEIKNVGDPQRPGIVHRLDIGTTGVMLAAKSQRAHAKLVEMFAEHHLDRQYMAITLGNKITNFSEQKIETLFGRDEIQRLRMKAYPLDSSDDKKTAITHYTLKMQWAPHNDQQGRSLKLFDLKLHTGRTHQIRVHLAQMLHNSLLNDDLYGHPEKQQQELKRFFMKEFSKDQQAQLWPQFQQELAEHPYPYLHAYRIAFKHPVTGVPLDFTSAPPKHFSTVIRWFNQHLLKNQE